MNGAAAAAVNGHANGHSSSSHSAESHGSRTLLIQHSGSGSKLSIPDIPIEVFGLADQLRDEFQDYLAGSESSADGQVQVRSSRLVAVPEGAEDAEEDQEDGATSGAPTVNNAPLFLASYWMEFLALQYGSNTARPILVATRDYFSTTFLSDGSLDIHSIGATLPDVQEKKLVISAWVKLCAKIGDGQFGAKGQIWREDNTREGGRVRNYAAFGGQGSNEYYWDEMEVS